MEVTQKDFAREVLQSELPVLVEFWGSWCPPCQRANSLLEEVERLHQGKVKIVKVNMDRNPGLITQYEILGAPTFILFRKGEEIKREVGSKTKKQLEQMIFDGE